MWDSHLRDTLEPVLAALDAEGLRTIALKGPVLAERLHADPTVRRSSDLDLLVLPADLEGAVQSLEGFDYRTDTGVSARYHKRYHHHCVLSHPRRPPVELHFRLYVGFGVNVEAQGFVERARLYQTRRGSRCYVLSPEDEFLYLCLHAAGHDFARLAWLYDLKRLLETTPTLNWQVLDARAASLGVRTAVSFSGAILRERLEVGEPALSRIGTRERSRHTLAHQLLGYWETLPESSGRAKLCSLLLQASLCDRVTGGAWLMQHHLARVARRRLQRWLPRLVPAHWGA